MKYNHHTFWLKALMGLFLMFGWALSASSQTPSMRHQVVSGETLFKIAQNYGVSVQQILACNPGLNADLIKAGQVIVIPSASVPAAQPVKPAAPKPQVQLKDYKVKKKDTPYALAKANGITVDELMEANPQLKEDGFKLKKGAVIKIPVKVYPKAPGYVGLSTLRVAVVLPLVGSKMENQRSVEFYRGLLMGIGTLKDKGVNVEVHAFQEPSPKHSVAQLLDTVRSMNPDLIVGPVYPTHFTDVSACAGAKTRVLVPFSSKVPQVDYQKNLFVVNTPASIEQRLSADMVLTVLKKTDHFVFLHSSNGAKTAFCQSLMTLLNASGHDVIGVAMHSDMASLAETLRQKGKGHFVLVPDDDSLEQMVASLSKVSELQKLLPGSTFSLMGYEEWLKHSEGNYRQALHAADTYVLATSYFYPFTADAVKFRNDYSSWFKSDLLECTPRMAPLGYDVAIGVLGGLATYGNDFNTQTPDEGTVAALPRLQSDLRFVKATSNGGYVSRSMWMVHFMTNGSIVKLSAK